MPITVERDDARRRFYAVATGDLTRTDILTLISQHRVGAFREYAIVFDASTATSLPSSGDIDALVSHVASLAARKGCSWPRGDRRDRCHLWSGAHVRDQMRARRHRHHPRVSIRQRRGGMARTRLVSCPHGRERPDICGQRIVGQALTKCYDQYVPEGLPPASP